LHLPDNLSSILKNSKTGKCSELGKNDKAIAYLLKIRKIQSGFLR